MWRGLFLTTLMFFESAARFYLTSQPGDWAVITLRISGMSTEEYMICYSGSKPIVTVRKTNPALTGCAFNMTVDIFDGKDFVVSKATNGLFLDGKKSPIQLSTDSQVNPMGKLTYDIWQRFYWYNQEGKFHKSCAYKPTGDDWVLSTVVNTTNCEYSTELIFIIKQINTACIGCSTCFNSTCYACAPGFESSLFPEACIPQYCNMFNRTDNYLICLSCEDGYSVNTSGFCQKNDCSADPNAELCDSAGLCVECKVGFKCIDGVCASSSCPTKLGCLFCTPSGSCVSCDTTLALVSGQCYLKICMIGCSACEMMGKCVACNSGMYLTSVGGCADYPCPLNTDHFQGGCASSNCTAAHCTRCNATVGCIECASGFQTVLGECFLDACSLEGCAFCKDVSTCGVCNLGLELRSGLCYFNNCEDSNCVHCTASTGCHSCAAGFVLVGERCYLETCEVPGCFLCVDSQSCAFCADNLEFHSVSIGCAKNICSESHCALCRYGMCLECRSPFYLTIDGVCEGCLDSRCEVCTVDVGVCEKCVIGFGVFEGVCYLQNCGLFGCDLCSDKGVCVVCVDEFEMKGGLCGCPKGTYRVGEGCELCGPLCIDCDGPTHCIECIGEAEVESGQCTACPNCLECETGVCAKCESGFFLQSGRCETCGENCELCRSAESCEACKSGSSLRSGRCEAGAENCETGSFRSGEICEPCPATCVGCASNTFCFSCVGKFVLSDGQCLDASELQNSEPNESSTCLTVSGSVCLFCVQGFYPLAGVCDECGEGCRACSSRLDCFECLPLYTEIKGLCIRSCLDSQFELDGECFDCAACPDCTVCPVCCGSILPLRLTKAASHGSNMKYRSNQALLSSVILIECKSGRCVITRIFVSETKTLTREDAEIVESNCGPANFTVRLATRGFLVDLVTTALEVPVKCSLDLKLRDNLLKIGRADSFQKFSISLRPTSPPLTAIVVQQNSWKFLSFFAFLLGMVFRGVLNSLVFITEALFLAKIPQYIHADGIRAYIIGVDNLDLNFDILLPLPFSREMVSRFCLARQARYPNIIEPCETTPIVSIDVNLVVIIWMFFSNLIPSPKSSKNIRLKKFLNYCNFFVKNWVETYYCSTGMEKFFEYLVVVSQMNSIGVEGWIIFVPMMVYAIGLMWTFLDLYLTIRRFHSSDDVAKERISGKREFIFACHHEEVERSEWISFIAVAKNYFLQIIVFCAFHFGPFTLTLSVFIQISFILLVALTLKKRFTKHSVLMIMTDSIVVFNYGLLILSSNGIKVYFWLHRLSLMIMLTVHFLLAGEDLVNEILEVFHFKIEEKAIENPDSNKLYSDNHFE